MMTTMKHEAASAVAWLPTELMSRPAYLCARHAVPEFVRERVCACMCVCNVRRWGGHALRPVLVTERRKRKKERKKEGLPGVGGESHGGMGRAKCVWNRVPRDTERARG